MAKSNWEVHKAQFENIIAQKESFTEFFDSIRQIFSAKAESYSGTRKPPINLRLLSQNAEFRIGISPYWDRRFHQIDPWKFLIDVMRQQAFDRPGSEVRPEFYSIRKVMTVAASLFRD